MNQWLRRLRGALGMGVTWALGWAVAGVLIGASSNLLPGLPWDSFFEVFDAPLPALAIPGFVAGGLFSIVLSVAARRRKFDELSLPKFALWGALGGLLLSLVPAALEAIGLLSSEGSKHTMLQVTAVIAIPFVTLSAISATVSLLLARRAQKKGAVAAGEPGSLLGEGPATATSSVASSHSRSAVPKS